MKELQADYSASTMLWDDIKSLSLLSMPIIFTALIQEISFMSTLIYVGRLSNPAYIGAMTLGNMICNISGYSLAYGMCSALDTLISQSYGARKYKLMGLWAQRAIVILTLCTLPVIAIWTQTEHILHYLLFIPITEARLAGVWSRIISIALYPSLCFEVLRKFLQGQNIVWPVVVAAIGGSAFNIIGNYYFMYHLKWGFTGVAYCWGFAQWFALSILIITIVARKLFLRNCGSATEGDSSVKAAARPKDASSSGIALGDYAVVSTATSEVDIQGRDDFSDSEFLEEFDSEDN